MTKVRIRPGSDLFPWAFASAVISSLPPGDKRNRLEYTLEMASMEHDDVLHNKKKRRKSEVPE